MPLWIVIMLLGAGGCGFAFLKAKEMESKNTLKKVKAGHKSVRKAAGHMAKQPSGIEEVLASTSEGMKIKASEDNTTIVVGKAEELRGEEWVVERR